MRTVVRLFVMGCHVVAFANGGKCGSTTLAMLLKHEWPLYTKHDPESPFEEAPKEVCAQNYNTAMCRTKRFFLDACPKAMTMERMDALRRSNVTVTIVVFARPQEEALLSLFNDKQSSGKHELSLFAQYFWPLRMLHWLFGRPWDADGWVEQSVGMQLFNYTRAYTEAVRRFSSVVLVETAELRTDVGVARVLSRLERQGVPPYKHSRAIVTNPTDARDQRHTQSRLSPKTVNFVRTYWAQTNLALCRNAFVQHLDCALW